MLHNDGFIRHELIPSLLELRQRAREVEHEFTNEIERSHTGFRDSARNLAHYLAIRRSDMRELQDELTFLGLSSLGRSESCVMSTLDNVLEVLHGLEGLSTDDIEEVVTTVDARTGPMYLADHAKQLLGHPDAHRQARIMVTMPSMAATEPALVLDLVRAGMDIMRINCAHDNAEAWTSMVNHLRAAERATGRTCKVYVDLGGPKLRTGIMDRLRVRQGDTLHIVKASMPIPAESLRGTSPVPCTLSEVFDSVSVGDRVWFDDGKIGAEVSAVDATSFDVSITSCKPGGAWLKAEKGINLPDTHLGIPALTEKDIDDLKKMAPHADIIGLSFLRHERDVRDLFALMHRLGIRGRGTVLKIETREAFERLPNILMEALRQPPVGVMVARGDLAVEVGFERLAEVQEEILWLCEAAHVPTIWATQVLEGMAKKGAPTRAEISDAAMSVRAECVMLNKGPHIVRAVQFLDDILHRMAAHQSKKRALLRKLHVSENAGHTSGD